MDKANPEFRPPATRLAPSPTGALHLGNARTFLVNWALARQRGWRVALRIDDLEGPRVKAGADAQAIEDLRWLGLTWDGPATRQSARVAAYEGALASLERAGRIYRCYCSRSEIERDATARAIDESPLYPGTCRTRHGSAAAAGENDAASLRFRVPHRSVSFHDAFFGPQRFEAATDLGDFVVRKSDGEFAYQLATVVDDAAAGVTHVVRGVDLLASTPRQVLLYGALGLSGDVPRYVHLPLIVGTDGRKLAKRHGDTRLRQLRDEGVTAGQVRRLLATWSGFEPRDPHETSTAEWVERFDLARLPREAVVYDDAHRRPTRR